MFNDFYVQGNNNEPNIDGYGYQRGGGPEPANPDQNLEKPENVEVKKPQPKIAKLNKHLQFSSIILEHFQQFILLTESRCIDLSIQKLFFDLSTPGGLYNLKDPKNRKF